MANAITHPTDKMLKTIWGLYEKGKRSEDWMVGFGLSKKEISRYIEVAISLIEKFRMWKEVRVLNCCYRRRSVQFGRVGAFDSIVCVHVLRVFVIRCHRSRVQVCTKR